MKDKKKKKQKEEEKKQKTSSGDKKIKELMDSVSQTNPEFVEWLKAKGITSDK